MQTCFPRCFALTSPNVKSHADLLDKQQAFCTISERVEACFDRIDMKQNKNEIIPQSHSAAMWKWQTHTWDNVFKSPDPRA